MTTLPGRLVRPLQPRDPQEQHRGATPLELFTDLCFVVAIAQAAAELHHAISADHAADGWVHFSMAFFAIWWAWLNFTWLSSAYDNDDLIQRLLTILQIVGSLVLAAGIPRMFEDDLVLGVTGYVVMRVALVAQWVRVSIHDPDHRATARRYAGGVLVVQLGWIGFLFVPQEMLLTCFAVGVIAELAVPVWAERPAMTPWHPHHIAERYGLFFIIVLGETVLSTTLAIQEALDLDEPAPEVAYVVAGGILIVFSMWWLYFARSAGVVLETVSGRYTADSYIWGFGHVFIFASGAAIGAGLAARVDFWIHHSEAPEIQTAAAVTVPVAVLIASMWFIQIRRHDPTGLSIIPFSVAVGLVLAATFTSIPELLTGLVCAALLAVELKPSGVAA